MRYDVVIFGSGIMGLVTAVKLKERGKKVLVLEKEGCRIGGVQTLASQGILHSGFKYLYSRDENRMFDDSIEWWDSYLSIFGNTSMLLSDRVCFVGNGILSKGSVWAASKLFRGTTPLFYNKGTCIVSEKVLNVEQTVRTLLREVIVSEYDYNSLVKMGNIIRFDRNKVSTEICADYFVLAAGLGNSDLASSIFNISVDQYSETFKMFSIKEQLYLPTLFEHHFTSRSLLSPTVTITTKEISGKNVWYIGGDVSKYKLSTYDLLATLKKLRSINNFIHNPCVKEDFVQVAKVDGTNPYVDSKHNCILAYPGKLVLAPYAADKVIERIV